MIQIQLDFFRSSEESELIALRDELRKTKESLDKVRKGTYARLNEQGKKVCDLEVRMNIIERGICVENIMTG
ncbi:MAG: hypothetical protein ACYC0F_19125 [Rhodanobacter sp.]